MIRHNGWFFLLLIVNTIIALLYLVLGWVFRSKQEGKTYYLLRACVMLLCPLVGPLYFFIGYLNYRFMMHRPVDLEDVIFSKDRSRSLMRADEERESNMVPLEEAIAVTDKDNLRAYMLNVLRGNIQDSLAAISMALNSEDSETSHYAASVLRDELNDFRVNVQKIYSEIVREDEDGELPEEAAESRDSSEPEKQQEADLAANADMTAKAYQEAEAEAVLAEASEGAKAPETLVTNVSVEELKRMTEKEPAKATEEESKKTSGEEPQKESEKKADRQKEVTSEKNADKKSKKKADAQEQEEEEKPPYDAEQLKYCVLLLEYINPVLQQKVFTNMEQTSFVELMDEVAEILFTYGKWLMHPEFYEQVCLRLMETKQYERAEIWGQRGLEVYGDVLSSYTCLLKLYFTIDEKEKFFELLDALKKSHIVVDSETLELIRVFG